MSSKQANQKRRNNEKRKEKSRVAARCRRTKEMQIFSELTAALPAKREEVEQLDKASVMRLAISYLRVRDVVSMLPDVHTEKAKDKNDEGLEQFSSELSYMKALDGFVLVMSQQGDIIYCSENIADHLGVSQMEIMGQSVFEFSHPCDHDEIREALRINSKGGRRDLMLRLKCTLTSKGRNVHLKSASYKVIHIIGHMLIPPAAKKECNNNNNEDKKADDVKKLKTGSLVAIGRPIPHPSNIEIPLDNKTFLSKHSLDMTFTYVDESLLNTLGFEPQELIGCSLYDYHHAADSAAMVQQFKSCQDDQSHYREGIGFGLSIVVNGLWTALCLTIKRTAVTMLIFSKGQCETGQYRFLAKTGGYAWVQTQATVITDKQQKPLSVVCVNYVISGIECKDEVFAAHQVHHVDLKPSVATISVTSSTIYPRTEPPPNGAIVAIVPPEDERPIPVTELLFAPREKEMNKGFLMFSQDEGLTMLKDEPEDLTHLAPTAGDACIPLENTPFDMFDFILSDNYCSLLGDDLANTSSVDALTPDSLLLSSPEPQENDSSCEQSSLLTELSLDAFDNTKSDNDIDDGNSPFIPSSDELPVLEPAVMWGALPDNVSLARPQPSETHTTSSAPALQRLLTSSTAGSKQQTLNSNIYANPGHIPRRSVSTWDTGVKRVMKQEQEPCAKRARRSPSPTVPTPNSKPSSSVLMNLLDIPQQSSEQNQHTQTSYHLIRNPQQSGSPNIKTMNRNSLPIPTIKIIQAVPNKHTIMRTNTRIPQSMRANTPIPQNMRTNTPIPQSIRTNTPISQNMRTNTPNPQSMRTNVHVQQNMRTNTPVPQNMHSNTPVPQSMLTNTSIQSMRTSMSSPMSPLSLNVGSPVYSLPSSPSSYNSPAMSPAQRDRMISPYSTPQSMSPVGKFHQVYSPGKRVMSPGGVLQGCDPYMTTKMQPSPGFPMQTDMLLDSNVPLTSSDFWNDADILQGTTDLLTAFDDVKLV